MTKLAAWILVFHLLHGSPTQRVVVRSCEDGSRWLQQAFAWADRSKVSRMKGPTYTCYWTEIKQS